MTKDLPIAKKSLGQHWLTDQQTLNYICDVGEIKLDDVVLEIGPGTGTLTEILVNKAKKVIAVEFDSELADDLPGRVKSPNLEVIQQDILQFNLSNLDPGYKVIANIPYYLTSKLIRVLSESTNQASLVVLLIQKEVAERVAAAPGKMSLLSISAQFYWHVGLGEVVPARLFVPAPKVDSRVITLDRRKDLMFPDVDQKLFFGLVKAGFASRRKTLLNSLAGGLRKDKEQIQKILDSANISSGLRAQALSLDDWHTIYLAYLEYKVF